MTSGRLGLHVVSEGEKHTQTHNTMGELGGVIPVRVNDSHWLTGGDAKNSGCDLMCGDAAGTRRGLTHIHTLTLTHRNNLNEAMMGSGPD